MSDVTMKDYVDAQSTATRAQNDARFAEVLNEMRTARSEISLVRENMLSWKVLLWNSIGIVISVVTLIYAIISYGADRFDGGVQFTSSTFEDSHDAKAISAENARQIKELSEQMSKRDAKIDALVEALKPNPPVVPSP